MASLENVVSFLKELESSNDTEVFVEKIAKIVDENLLVVLKKVVIDGNNSSMNDYIFNLPPDDIQPIIWVGAVKFRNEKRFIWMVGEIDKQTLKIRELITDGLINNASIKINPHPPFLLYVNTFFTSTWQKNKDTGFISQRIGEDYAIFQTPYEGEDVIEDIDQRMTLNSSLLSERLTNIKRLVVNSCDESIVNFSEENIFSNCDLLTKLHAELHNIGHFIGPWSYSIHTKKSVEYETIEEFRACLAAVKLVEYLDLSTSMKDSFALSVVFNRFFGYGFTSFLEKKKNRGIIREITVGLLFFEILIQKNIFFLNDALKLCCNFNDLRPALIDTLDSIHQDEYEIIEKVGKNTDDLRRIAEKYYKIAYPNGAISYEASSIYEILRQLIQH